MPDPVSLQMLAPASRFVFQAGPGARTLASRAFGVVLPDDACRANATETHAALWLGPDEHLLLGPAGEARAIASALAIALAGVPHSLVEVSQRQVAISIAGPCASALVNSGCPLDFDLAAFPVMSCTRTVLGKAEVVLWRRSAEEYHLEVGRSFSRYVTTWFQEAARSDLR